ncbi:MAG: lysophospholipid acyltransferase family protein [Longimicrobiaceae bacterium]
MPAPSWKHRAEYGLARALQSLVTTLPEGAAERLGRGVGALVHSPLAIRRGVAEENLRRAFPDASEEWVERTARAAFRHLGRESAAILRLSRLDARAIVERTEMEGWEALQEGLSEGRGALLATGHFGNWEIGAASIAARGIPMEAVVKRLANRLVDARLDELRRRLGVETIDMGEAPQRIPRALRAGHVVGMVADQDARHTGVWVPFFGHPASTHRGPALFALRLRAPLFASFARRLPGRGARYHIRLERLTVRRTTDMEADLRRVTAELNERLESAIRAHPEQYFWFHRRWKSVPPAELTP